MKKHFFIVPCVALSILASACSVDSFESVTDTENCEVKLQISTSGWNGSVHLDETTRAGEILSPVTVLLVSPTDQKVVKRTSVEGSSFSITVPRGTYDLYAVCGLPSDDIPDNLLSPITIPDAGENGLADFAVGKQTITYENGILSPSTVTIVAKRQMAWLTATITDIPSYFAECSLFMKGAGESYNIAEGWSTTNEGKSAFSNCNIAQKKGKNFAIVDKVRIPCTDSSGGTEFRLIGKTSDGRTLTYAFTSTTPLVAGKHLTLNLSISDLAPLSDAFTQNDWDDSEESATLSDPTITTGN